MRLFTDKFILSVLLAAGIISNISAQYSVDNYFFQQQTANYVPVSGGTILGDINIDEQVFNASTTGAVSIVNGPGFPIGFPFALGGEVFTRFAVGTNGYITLGNNNFSIANTVASAFTGTPFNLADTVAYANMLAAFHADIQGQTGSELSFQTIGTEPNRECIIQWKKFRIYLATGDDFNFQIRLRENGNKVVFSYGQFIKGPDTRKVSVGIRGAAYNVVHMRKAEQAGGETWSSSSKSLDRLKQSDLNATFTPDNGLEYTFYNPAQTANDIGLDKASLSPEVLFGCPGTSSEPIFVRAFNYGDSTQSSFPYQIRINNGPVLDGLAILNPPLAKNQFRIITLSQTLDLSQPGPLQVKIWSKLEGDTGIYAINDTSAIKTTIFASVPTPAPPLKSFSEFSAKGWKTYRGKSRPKTNNGRFTAGTQFSSGTTAIQVLAFSTDTIFDWMVSPAYQPSPNLRLKFRAAITGYDTITPISTGIDNDEIRFLISDDCGSTWNTLYQFDNNSVTGGAISNQKKGYSVPLPALSGPFQIAVFVSNKGTSPAGTYFFHLDDLTLNQGNSYDLGTRRVQIDNQNNPNCDQTSFTVRAWVKNEGDSAISSSAASATVNNGAAQIQNFNFNPVLQPGDSAEIVFPSVTVNPNSGVKLLVRSLLSSEDGFSAANDTAAIRFVYIGASNPLALPLTINFDNLPSGVPAGWLVEQNQGSDFKVRVRGTNSSRSLSTNMYSGNKSSYAIAPTTAPIPANSLLSFDLRLKNDLAGPFNFNAGDSVTASISTDCGASWISVFKTKAGQPFGFENFQKANIDLADYAGSAIALRFEVWINRNDNTGAWVDIDNINISENTAVNPLKNQSSILFFPNPAKDNIRFGKEIPVQNTVLKFFSPDGRLMKQSELNAERNVSVGELPSGIYLMELQTKTSVSRGRIVIE